MNKSKTDIIEEMIDAFITGCFNDALNNAFPYLPDYLFEQEINPFPAQYQNDENSLIDYFKLKVKEYILKLALTEVTICRDCEESKLLSSKDFYTRYYKIKNSNWDEECAEFLNAKRYDYVNQKSKKAIHTYSSPVKNNHISPELESKPRKFNLYKFKYDYTTIFDFKSYITRDLAFLNWSKELLGNSDLEVLAKVKLDRSTSKVVLKKEVFLSSLIPYIGFIMDNLTDSNNLFHRCEIYNEEVRKGEKADNPSSNFSELEEKYSDYLVYALDLLGSFSERKNKDTAEYQCNEFMLDNILHYEFFNSISDTSKSSMFNYISKHINMRSLLNEAKTIDEVAQCSESYLFLHLLQLLMMYNIDLSALEKLNFKTIELFLFQTDSCDGIAPIEKHAPALSYYTNYLARFCVIVSALEAVTLGIPEILSFVIDSCKICKENANHGKPDFEELQKRIVKILNSIKLSWSYSDFELPRREHYRERRLKLKKLSSMKFMENYQDKNTRHIISFLMHCSTTNGVIPFL